MDQSNTKGKLGKGGTNATSVTGTATPPPNIQATTSYSIFEHSVQRAQNLISIHEVAHGSASRPRLNLADTYRAAIVLAISALDAFVHTLVIEKAINIVADLSKPAPPKLIKKIKECLKEDELFEAARQSDLSSRIAKVFREEFEDQSFQGVKKISETMELIGYTDIFQIIASNAKKNEKQLKETLGKFTKRRHLIAHCGDYDLSQTPSYENKISKKDVKDCISTVKLVASEINKIL